MESPLSFDSTENFRKKLLAKNLKPYKVDGGFTYGDVIDGKEYQIIDYSVVDIQGVDVIGETRETFLRNKNKFTPDTGNGFGDTKWSINNDNVTNTNLGPYDVTDTQGDELELSGRNKRNSTFPMNQYGPQRFQSQNEVNPNINKQTRPNEGNYDFSDTVGSPLEVAGTQNLNIQINQYGPSNGINPRASDYNVKLPNKSFEGEYGFNKTIDSGLEIIGTNKEVELYVKNKYVPSGSYTQLTIDDIILGSTNQKYYNSTKSFVFVPSTYSPISLLTSDNPTGSNGSLSQDSTLANLGAKQLQKEFKFRVATELVSQTIGRVNLLNSSVNPDSGEISVKPKLDPFNGLGILTNNVPLLSKNYKITSPDLLTGKIIDFASKLAGLYSPYSIIPDEYFDYPEKRLLNQIEANPIGTLGKTIMGGIRSVTSSNIRRGSDLFLAYTSPATRDLLWGQMFYNQYRPDYRGNSGRNPNLFSPKPNFYVGSRKNTIIEIVSPINDLPEYKDGEALEIQVYGAGEIAKDYEGSDISKIKFGLNTRDYYDGNVAILGNFTWTAKDNFFQPGKSVGILKDAAGTLQKKEYGTNVVYSSTQETGFKESQSYTKKFKEGSILDITQKIVDAGSRKVSKPFQHVGNAINQVSKVFDDGYIELTKGSRVIKYKTKNSIEKSSNGAAEGFEYCRLFTKDIPYYTYNQLQKTDGNIRKYSYSVMDNTYNLNIAPMNDKNGQSTNINNGKVKKYMFSLENLAWRTSNKPGYRVDDLPACEIGPNGGRIMWFPPYDLTFDESSKADFNSVDFIGRPEQIYTYKNTTRGGNISWSIIVDHPSISNVILNNELKNVTPDSEITKVMSSFFAGCLKYDLYELSKRYVQFSPNDIQTAINEINNKESAIKAASNTPQGQTNGTSTEQNTLDALNNFNDIYLFFDQNIPEGNGGTTDEIYNNLLTTYISQKSSYGTSAKDKIFSYKNDDQTLPNDTANFPYDEYVDSRQSSIADFFDSKITIDKLNTFLVNISKVLDSGGEVTFTLMGNANSVGDKNSNKNLSKRRISSVINYIKKHITPNNKKLEEYYNKTLKINEDPQGDTGNINDDNLKEIDCSKEFKKQKEEGKYSVQAMACRRTKITNLKINQTPSPKKTTNEAPESALNNPTAGDTDNDNQTYPTFEEFNKTNIESPLQLGVAKRLIRNLLTECNYFEMLSDSDPFVYDGFKKRFKHFQPVFHSITPEGLNSRLTFLQQCMRPGDTIPTVKLTDAGTYTLDYQDAFNSAFGAPPVLVLRIGDFYNTKIIPENLNIKFESTSGLFDLNPEGIGVQPMIAQVTLSFKFIGGSGMANPVARLQNSLSFNYYANTEMYDERAEATEDVTSKYDAEFYEQAKQNVPIVTQSETQNKYGNTFGKITTSTPTNDGGETGQINYKNKFNELISNALKYQQTIVDSLKKINDSHLLGGLYIVNTDRKYTEGFFDNINTPNDDTKKVEIYGKSVKTQNKIDLLFDKLIKDITNNTPLIPLLSNLDSQNFSNSQKNKIKNKLKDMVKSKKDTYLNDVSEFINKTTETDLKLIPIIDQLNFVVNNKDGYKTEKQDYVVYTTSGSSSNELKTNFLQIGNDLKKFKQELEKNIIGTTDKTKWNNSFDFDLYVGQENVNRFNMVFGKDILTDVKSFINQIVSVITDETEKKTWIDYLSFNIDYDYNNDVATHNDGIYALFKDQKTKTDKWFTDISTYSGLNENYRIELKDKDYVLDFTKQLPPNGTDLNNLKDLYSEKGSQKDIYNLKTTLK